MVWFASSAFVVDVGLEVRMDSFFELFAPERQLITIKLLKSLSDKNITSLFLIKLLLIFGGLKNDAVRDFGSNLIK